jgi:hypothetical protein
MEFCLIHFEKEVSSLNLQEIIFLTNYHPLSLTDRTALQEESQISTTLLIQCHMSFCRLYNLQIVYIHYCRLLPHTICVFEFLQVVGHLQKILFHRFHRYPANVNFVEADNCKIYENLFPIGTRNNKARHGWNESEIKST